MKLENLATAARVAALLEANQQNLKDLPEAFLLAKQGFLSGGADEEYAEAGAKGMVDALTELLQRRVKSGEAQLAELGVEVASATLAVPTTADVIQHLLDHAPDLRLKDVADLHRARILAAQGTIAGTSHANCILLKVQMRRATAAGDWSGMTDRQARAGMSRDVADIRTRFSTDGLDGVVKAAKRARKKKAS